MSAAHLKTDALKPLLDRLGLIVALLAAAFAAWTAWEAHAARKDAEDAAQAAEKSAQTQARAYVGVDTVEIPNANDAILTFDLRVSGNTPAYRVALSQECDLVSLGHLSEFAKSAEGKLGSGVLIGYVPAGMTKRFMCSPAPSIEPPKIVATPHGPRRSQPSKKEVDSSAEEPFVLIGRVTCADIFNVKHSTDFCYEEVWMNGKPEFWPCLGFGNQAN